MAVLSQKSSTGNLLLKESWQVLMNLETRFDVPELQPSFAPKLLFVAAKALFSRWSTEYVWIAPSHNGWAWIGKG